MTDCAASCPPRSTCPPAARLSQTFRPSPALRPWLDAIWDCRIENASEARRSLVEILPSAFPIVTFQYGGPLARSIRRDHQGSTGSACAGVQSAVVRLRPISRLAFLTVRLKPWALARLVREPATRLTDRGVDLRQFWPASEIAAVEEQLAETDSAAARIALVESFLARRLNETDQDGDAQAALRLIVSGKVRTVAGLSRTLGISERRLHRTFRDEVGVGPKRFVRIARVERALASYAAAHNWAGAAQDAGYCDQAHLVRDFQSLVGEAPQRFLGARLSACTAAAPMLGFLHHAPRPRRA